MSTLNEKAWRKYQRWKSEAIEQARTRGDAVELHSDDGSLIIPGATAYRYLLEKIVKVKKRERAEAVAGLHRLLISFRDDGTLNKRDRLAQAFTHPRSQVADRVWNQAAKIAISASTSGSQLNEIGLDLLRMADETQ